MTPRAAFQRVGLLAAGVFLAISFAGPIDRAEAQGTWTGSSSPEDLLYRLDVLSAEIADIRAQLGGSVQQPARTGAGGDVGVLEDEIRRLTAKVERLENQVRQLSSNTENQIGDLVFRVNELEGIPNDDSGSQPLIQDQGASIEQTASVSVSEQGDLDRAVNDVNQGRFDQAEDRLRQFLSSYPSSPLTGEAWFWLGESQFVRGNLADSARSYLNGYQVDRSGRRAAGNLLKLGTSLGRLGQLNEACKTLAEVRRQFPNSTEAGRADAEADNLTCG
ncbi:MAG: tol-pal system protein YbgF [Pseudomonadota bacterium]